MQELNTIFRGVPKATDILSFPQISAEEQKCRRPNSAKVKNFHKLTSWLLGFRTSELILGDIVININQAKRQAKEYGLSFHDEIYRLLIHGILHLLRYNHEKGGRMARVMRKKEEELFNAIKKVN